MFESFPTVLTHTAVNNASIHLFGHVARRGTLQFVVTAVRRRKRQGKTKRKDAE